MRYFFIDQPAAPGESVYIRGSDAKHIRDVLRCKTGDGIGLLDGSGVQYHARIDGFSSKGVSLTVMRNTPLETESTVRISVAQALLKKRKMDGIVRQLTELGISRWIPFLAERSIPRPDTPKMAARISRWEAICREACKQCRRSRLMQIDTLKTFKEVIQAGKTSDLKILFWEAENRQKVSTPAEPRIEINRIFLILGPEGGFTDAEIKLAREADFITMGLGPRILRSETAAIAASTLIQYRYGDMG